MIMFDKGQLRKRITEIRRNLPIEAIKVKSEVISKKLCAISLLYNYPDIFTYVPDGRGEVDVWRFIYRSYEVGRRIWLPRIEGNRLKWHCVDRSQLDYLTPNSWGILEPLPEWQPCIDTIVTPGLCIVPGVVFDRRGYRIGRGKGYFDRFLCRSRCISIGIGYTFQLVPLCPHSAWDVKVDWVITEDYVFHCSYMA